MFRFCGQGGKKRGALAVDSFTSVLTLSNDGWVNPLISTQIIVLSEGETKCLSRQGEREVIPGQQSLGSGLEHHDLGPCTLPARRNGLSVRQLRSARYRHN